MFSLNVMGRRNGKIMATLIQTGHSTQQKHLVWKENDQKILCNVLDSTLWNEKGSWTVCILGIPKSLSAMFVLTFQSYLLKILEAAPLWSDGLKIGKIYIPSSSMSQVVHRIINEPDCSLCFPERANSPSSTDWREGRSYQITDCSHRILSMTTEKLRNDLSPREIDFKFGRSTHWTT